MINSIIMAIMYRATGRFFWLDNEVLDKVSKEHYTNPVFRKERSAVRVTTPSTNKIRNHRFTFDGDGALERNQRLRNEKCVGNLLRR